MIPTIRKSLKLLALSTCLVVGQGVQATTIQVSGNLTGTINWINTNEYVLNGFVYVLDGGVLNIEPGSVIRGKSGTGLNAAALFKIGRASCRERV